MSDSFVRVAADGSGKKIRTFESTVGANTVEAQAVVLVDSAGNLLGTNFLEDEVARVDEDGSDSTGAVGNISKPFATVQGAITALEAIGGLNYPVVDVVNADDLTGTVTTSLATIRFKGAAGRNICTSLILTNTITALILDNCSAPEVTCVGLNAWLLSGNVIDVSSSGNYGITLRGAGSLNSVNALGSIVASPSAVIVLEDVAVSDINSPGCVIDATRCLIGSITAGGALTLRDSRVTGTNNASSTAYADVFLKGVPSGGTSAQVLAKVDGADFNTEWVDPTAGATSVTSAALASVDAHAETASGAATSADAHANTVSARVVSVSAELGSLVQIASAAATSADAHANTASAAATSADAHANTVSARVVSVSAELGSLVQIASLAATSADGHANTASAAATSADAHANTVSARVVSVSAEVASLVQIASAAATSADAHANTVSNAVSNETSDRHSVSAALETHINTVSARVVSVSNELGSLVQIASAAATSADGHANTASAAATSADGHANTVSAAANVVSARVVSVSAELASLVQIASAAATSADGHANTISARVVSVSNELGSLVQIASAAATSADGHANTVSVRAVSISNELGSLVNIVSNATSNEISVRAAASAALETHINTVSARAVSVSNELGSLVQIASLAATSADGHANTVSARVVSVSAEVASLVQIASAAATSVDARLNNVSAASGAGSVKGLQSVLNKHSNAISIVSARVVSVSAELASLVQIASAAATSADGHANTVSARVVSVSAEVASLVQIASAAATSADGHANTVSARVVSVSAEVASLVQIASAAATSADGHANTVSARVVSVSAELVSLMVSADAKRAVNTANQAVITISTGVTVSGVSVALVSGQTYNFQFQIPFTTDRGTGITVGVVGPATNQYFSHYQIPGAVAATGVAPAANAVTPFFAEVRAINTLVSTTSITLSATTLMAEAWGTINPSANGSIKFIIGPSVGGGTGVGVIVLRGANVMVTRLV